MIETFDDEKIPDEKDHKRDRDISFSMAALPIPLGPLGGLTSLAGLIPFLNHIFHKNIITFCHQSITHTITTHIFLPTSKFTL